MTDLSTILRALKDSAIHYPCGDRLIKLSGADCADWLQGQITNDVRKLDSQSPLRFCICRPTGQLQAVASAYSLDGNIFIVTDRPKVVLARVEQMVIMEDVSAELLPLILYSAQGPAANDVAGGEYRLSNDRSGRGGLDIWLSPSEAPPKLPSPSNPEELVNIVSMEALRPLSDQDYSDRTLPPELGPSFEVQHISYQKGCYTGQEVLMRIHSRGHTNKTWVGLRSSDPIPEGQDVLFEGEPVGKVTRAGFSDEFGYLAVATISNRAAAPGAHVKIESVTASVFSYALPA